MVRFSFCKKPLEAEKALYSAISLLTRTVPLLENLRYSAVNLLLLKALKFNNEMRYPAP